MRNILIGFTGKAQAGKTECAKILEDLVVKDGLKFIKISFASPLKEIATRYFGWDGSKKDQYIGVDGPTRQFEDGTGKDEKNPILVQDQGRQLLINIGMKFREIRPTIWIDLAYKHLVEKDKETPEGIVFCMDDVRFKNELYALGHYKGTSFVKVVRPIGQLSIDDISEKDLDDVEFKNIIDNTGTIEDLAKAVEGIYNAASSASN
jgi:hypothetical protein